MILNCPGYYILIALHILMPLFIVYKEIPSAPHKMNTQSFFILTFKLLQTLQILAADLN